MNKIFDDPEFQALDNDRKERILENYFMDNMADDEYFELEEDHQSKIFENFATENGLVYPEDNETEQVLEQAQAATEVEPSFIDKFMETFTSPNADPRVEQREKQVADKIQRTKDLAISQGIAKPDFMTLDGFSEANKAAPDLDTKASDYGNSIMSGGANVYSGTGWLVNKLGQKLDSNFLQQGGIDMMVSGDAAANWWKKDLSHDAHLAEKKKLIGDTLGTTLANIYSNPQATGLAVSESLLGTAAGMGVGGGLAKAFKLVPKVGQAFADALGFGFGEGTVAAGSSGKQTEDKVLKMSHKELEKAPEYMALINDGVEKEEAKRIVARAAGGDAAAVTFVTTSAMSAPMGMLVGKFLRTGEFADGFFKSFAVGTSGEAAQETMQSGTEQWSQNAAIKKWANPNQDLSEGVAEASLKGFLSGGAMGGGMAAAGSAGTAAVGSTQYGKKKAAEREIINILDGEFEELTEEQYGQIFKSKEAAGKAMGLFQTVRESPIPVTPDSPEDEQSQLMGGLNLHEYTLLQSLQETAEEDLTEDGKDLLFGLQQKQQGLEITQRVQPEEETKQIEYTPNTETGQEEEITPQPEEEVEEEEKPAATHIPDAASRVVEVEDGFKVLQGDGEQEWYTYSTREDAENKAQGDIDLEEANQPKIEGKKTDEPSLYEDITTHPLFETVYENAKITYAKDTGQRKGGGSSTWLDPVTGEYRRAGNKGEKNPNDGAYLTKADANKIAKGEFTDEIIEKIKLEIGRYQSDPYLESYLEDEVQQKSEQIGNIIGAARAFGTEATPTTSIRPHENKIFTPKPKKQISSIIERVRGERAFGGTTENKTKSIKMPYKARTEAQKEKILKRIDKLTAQAKAIEHRYNTTKELEYLSPKMETHKIYKNIQKLREAITTPEEKFDQTYRLKKVIDGYTTASEVKEEEAEKAEERETHRPFGDIDINKIEAADRGNGKAADVAANKGKWIELPSVGQKSLGKYGKLTGKYDDATDTVEVEIAKTKNGKTTAYVTSFTVGRVSITQKADPKQIRRWLKKRGYTDEDGGLFTSQEAEDKFTKAENEMKEWDYTHKYNTPLQAADAAKRRNAANDGYLYSTDGKWIRKKSESQAASEGNNYAEVYDAIPTEKRTVTGTQRGLDLEGTQSQLFDTESREEYVVPKWVKPLISDTVRYRDIISAVAKAKAGKDSDLAKRVADLYNKEFKSESEEDLNSLFDAGQSESNQQIPTAAEVLGSEAAGNNIEAIEHRLKYNSGYETLVAVDKHGRILINKKGEKSQVAISVEQGLILAQADETILTHNHPSASSFSNPDIRLTFHKRLDEIRAIGMTKDATYLYSLSDLNAAVANSDYLSGLSSNELSKILGTSHEHHYQLLWDRYNGKAIKWGMKSYKAVGQAHTHEAMKAFAKEWGFDYTRTKIRQKRNFKEWFNNSTITNEQGDPLVVYHGTSENFDSFQNKVNWFTPSSSLAYEYALIDRTEGKAEVNDGTGSNIMPVYLRITNPLEIRNVTVDRTARDFAYEVLHNSVEQVKALPEEKQDEILENIMKLDNKKSQPLWSLWDNNQDLIDVFTDMGYDGFKTNESGTPTYGIFSSNQVKSTSNKGTWSNETDDISAMPVSFTEASPEISLGLTEEQIAEITDLWTLAGKPTLSVVNHILNDKNGHVTAGTYNNRTHHILIAKGYENVYHVIKHEMLHPIYNKLIRDNPELSRNLAGLIRELEVTLEGQGIDSRDHYGASDIEELLPEFFSNPKFRKLLDETPYEGRQTANKKKPVTFLEKFIELLKKMLGRETKASVSDMITTLLDGYVIEARVDNVTLENGQEISGAEAFRSVIELAMKHTEQKVWNKDQLLGYLEKKGVSPEELVWSGLNEFLETKEGKKIHSDELLKAISLPILHTEYAAGKFDSYTEDIKDGKEYTEILTIYGTEDLEKSRKKQEEYKSKREIFQKKLTKLKEEREALPFPNSTNKTKEERAAQSEKFTKDIHRLRAALKDTEEKMNALSKKVSEQDRKIRNTTYVDHSHWAIHPNVLYWVRKQDTNIDGDKTLFIEEIQSSQHQKGRKHGYLTEQETGDEIAVNDARAKFYERSVDHDVLISEFSTKVEYPYHRIDRAVETAAQARDKNSDSIEETLKVRNKEVEAQIKLVKKITAKRLEIIKDNTPEEVMAAARATGGGMSDITDYLAENLEAEEYQHFYELEERAAWETENLIDLQTQEEELIKIHEYSEDPDFVKLVDIKVELNETEKAMHKIITEKSKSRGEKVPNAPFAKTWHEKALKDMIDEAVKNGYERVAWTSAEIQNERYSLNLDKIIYSKAMSENVDLDGERVSVIATTPTRETAVMSGEYTQERLAEMIGEELAEKIYSTATWNNQVLEGEDLKDSGKGMIGFYDEKMVFYAKRYLKKYKSKLEVKNIETESGKKEVWSFEVTEKMKEDVKERGQAMFGTLPNWVQEEEAGYGEPKTKPLAYVGSTLSYDTTKEATTTTTAMSLNPPMMIHNPNIYRPADNKITIGRTKVTIPKGVIYAATIREAFTKLIGERLYSGNIPKTRLGHFNPTGGEIRLQFKDDIEVLGHEMLHYLMTVKTQEIQDFIAANTEEIEKYSYTAVANLKTEEGMAELIRAYLTQSDYIVDKSGDLYENLEIALKSFGKKDFALIKKIQLLSHGYYRQGYENINKAAIATIPTKIETLKQGIKDTFDGSMNVTKFIDLAHPLKLMTEALGLNTGYTAKNPYILMRLATGHSESVIEGFTKYGTGKFGADGSLQFTGEGLSEVFKAALKEGGSRSHNNKILDDLYRYFQLKQSEYIRDEQERDIPFNSFALDEEITRLETRDGFKVALKKMIEFNERMIEFYISANYITKEAGAAFLDKNPFYVPMHRVVQGESAGTGSSNAIMGRSKKGSKRQLLPVDNIFAQLEKNISNALLAKAVSKMFEQARRSKDGAEWATHIPKRTERYQALIEQQATHLATVMLSEGMTVNEDGDIVPIDDENPYYQSTKDEMFAIMVQKIRENPSLINFYRSGNEPISIDGNVYSTILNDNIEFFEIDKGTENGKLLIEMMEGATSSFERGNILKVMHTVKSGMTRSIVTMPDFVLGNLFIDTTSAGVYAKTNFIPFYDSAKGVAKAIKEDEEFKLFILNGGAFGTRVEMATKENAKRQMMKLAINEKSMARFWAIYDRVLSYGEIATRVGEYANARSDGTDPLAAAHMATEITTDFNMHGSNHGMNALRSTVAFLPASINSIYKDYREFTMRDAGKGQKFKAAATFAAKGITYITLPAIAAMFLFDDDEDDIPRTAVEDAMFSHYKIGDTVFKHKTQYLLGLVFEKAPRMAREAFIKDEGERAGKILKAAVWTMLVPDATPTIASPFVDIKTNRNFTGSPIIPYRLQGLTGENQYLQFKEHTPLMYKGTAQYLRKQGVNVSPLEIQQVVRGYTGYVGKWIEDGFNKVLWNEEEYGEMPNEGTVTKHLMHHFKYKDYGQSYYSDQYYKLREKAQSALQAVYFSRKGNGDIEMEIKNNSHTQAMAMVMKDLQKVDKKMKLLRNETSKIRKRKDLTADQKEDLILKKNREIALMQRDAHAKYEDMEESSTPAKDEKIIESHPEVDFKMSVEFSRVKDKERRDLESVKDRSLDDMRAYKAFEKNEKLKLLEILEVKRKETEKVVRRLKKEVKEISKKRMNETDRERKIRGLNKRMEVEYKKGVRKYKKILKNY